MRFFKLIVFSFLFLFIIISLLGLLLPSNVVVSRAVDVRANPEKVFAHTKDLISWKTWITTLQSASFSSANKAKLGNATISLLSITNNKIVGEWVEGNGKKQVMALSIIPSQNNITIVQWQFEQHVKWYPWERFSTMVNDKVIGGLMEENLAKLKAIVEK